MKTTKPILTIDKVLIECLATQKTALITSLQNCQEALKKNMDNLTYWEEKAAEVTTENQRLKKVVKAQNYTIEHSAEGAKYLREARNDNCHNCEKAAELKTDNQRLRQIMCNIYNMIDAEANQKE